MSALITEIGSDDDGRRGAELVDDDRAEHCEETAAFGGGFAVCKTPLDQGRCPNESHHIDV
jgi:hypothetical protein